MPPAGHGSPGVFPLAQPQVSVHHCQLRGGEGEEAFFTPRWGPGAAPLGRGPRSRAPAPGSLAGRSVGSRFRRRSGQSEEELGRPWSLGGFSPACQAGHPGLCPRLCFLDCPRSSGLGRALGLGRPLTRAAGMAGWGPLAGPTRIVSGGRIACFSPEPGHLLLSEWLVPKDWDGGAVGRQSGLHCRAAEQLAVSLSGFSSGVSLLVCG